MPLRGSRCVNVHQILKQMRRLSAAAHNALAGQVEHQTLFNQFLFNNKLLATFRL